MSKQRTTYRMERDEYGSPIQTEAAYSSVEQARGNFRDPTPYSVFERRFPLRSVRAYYPDRPTSRGVCLNQDIVFSLYPPYPQTVMSAVEKAAASQLSNFNGENGYMLLADLLFATKGLVRYTNFACRILQEFITSGVDVKAHPSSASASAMRRFLKVFTSVDFQSRIGSPNPLVLPNNPGRTLPQTFGDAWLELQYSILPSMHACAALFNGLSGSQEPLMRVTTQYSLPLTADHSKNSYTFDTAWSSRGTCSTRCFRYLKASNPLPDFNLSGPALAEAVWDVIPFSFLVDWVMPVSSMLQSWAPGALRSAKGCNCTKYTLDGYVESTLTRYAKGMEIDGPNSSNFREFQFRRRVDTTMGAQNLQVSEAWLLSRLRLSATKVVNAVALISQRNLRR